MDVERNTRCRARRFRRQTLRCSWPSLRASNPRQLAQAIVDCNSRESELITKIEIAGPGDINPPPLLLLAAYRCRPTSRSCLAFSISAWPKWLQQARRWSERSSANSFRQIPRVRRTSDTGGKRRSAMRARGVVASRRAHPVSREFYYNDAGVQIQNLALSVQAARVARSPAIREWQEGWYAGEYIQDIANDFLARKTVHAFDGEPIRANGKIDDLDAIRRFAVTCLRHEQDMDLAEVRRALRHVLPESSLYSDGKVETTVQGLVAQRPYLRERRRAVAARPPTSATTKTA